MLNEYKSILIDPETSVRNAMQQLDKTAEKILFVVEQDNKLRGSLTDGDIRRWILNEGSLKTPVSKVCFKGTFYVKNGYNLDDVKAEIIKRKIVYVPVTNEQKQIIEFLVWDRLFDQGVQRRVQAKLEIPVVIMAGGKGTRLDPFTRILPKPLIPIGDKTILEIIIDKFVQYQVNQFYISVNYKARIIKAYLEELNNNHDYFYLEENKPLGTAGALAQLKDQVKTPVLVTNCDIIIDMDYADLARHHIEKGNDITMVASVKHYNIPYGVCEIENGGQLREIKEKPEYSFLINTGMYILSPAVLSLIPENELFHITHLIEKVSETGGKVGIYPISENAWVDTGEWEEYKKTTARLTL